MFRRRWSFACVIVGLSAATSGTWPALGLSCALDKELFYWLFLFITWPREASTAAHMSVWLYQRKPVLASFFFSFFKHLSSLTKEGLFSQSCQSSSLTRSYYYRPCILKYWVQGTCKSSAPTGAGAVHTWGWLTEESRLPSVDNSRLTTRFIARTLAVCGVTRPEGPSCVWKGGGDEGLQVCSTKPSRN